MRGMFVYALAGLLACSSTPGETDPPPSETPEETPVRPRLMPQKLDPIEPGSRTNQPLTGQIALLRIGHYKYSGHELFVDGQPRGPLPLDTTLTFGTHRFEILVGPGDRLLIEKEVKRTYGMQLFDLAEGDL